MKRLKLKAFDDDILYSKKKKKPNSFSPIFFSFRLKLFIQSLPSIFNNLSIKLQFEQTLGSHAFFFSNVKWKLCANILYAIKFSRIPKVKLYFWLNFFFCISWIFHWYFWFLFVTFKTCAILTKLLYRIWRENKIFQIFR